MTKASWVRAFFIATSGLLGSKADRDMERRPQSDGVSRASLDDDLIGGFKFLGVGENCASMGPSTVAGDKIIQTNSWHAMDANTYACKDSDMGGSVRWVTYDGERKEFQATSGASWSDGLDATLIGASPDGERFAVRVNKEDDDEYYLMVFSEENSIYRKDYDGAEVVGLCWYDNKELAVVYESGDDRWIKGYELEEDDLVEKWKTYLGSELKAAKKMACHQGDPNAIYVSGNDNDGKRAVVKLGDDGDVEWESAVDTTNGTPVIHLRGSSEVLLISKDFYARLDADSGAVKFLNIAKNMFLPPDTTAVAVYDPVSDRIFSAQGGSSANLCEHDVDEGWIRTCHDISQFLAPINEERLENQRDAEDYDQSAYDSPAINALHAIDGSIIAVGQIEGRELAYFTDSADGVYFFEGFLLAMHPSPSGPMPTYRPTRAPTPEEEDEDDDGTPCGDSSSWHKKGDDSKGCSWVADLSELSRPLLFLTQGAPTHVV